MGWRDEVEQLSGPGFVGKGDADMAKQPSWRSAVTMIAPAPAPTFKPFKKKPLDPHPTAPVAPATFDTWQRSPQLRKLAEVRNGKRFAEATELTRRADLIRAKKDEYDSLSKGGYYSAKAGGSDRAPSKEELDSIPRLQEQAAAIYNEIVPSKLGRRWISDFDAIQSGIIDPGTGFDMLSSLPKHRQGELRTNGKWYDLDPKTENLVLAKEDQAARDTLAEAKLEGSILNNTAGRTATRFGEGVNALTGEVFVRPFSADVADELQRNRTANVGAISKAAGPVENVFGDIAQSAGTMAATAGLAVASGGTATPGVMAAGFGVARAGEALTEAKDAGLSRDKQLEHMLLQGGIEGGTALVFSKLLKMPGLEGAFSRSAVDGATTKQITTQVAKRLAKSGIEEVPEELATQVLSNLAARLTVDPNRPALTTDELIDVTIQSFLAGAVMNTPAGIADGAAAWVKQRPGIAAKVAALNSDHVSRSDLERAGVELRRNPTTLDERRELVAKVKAEVEAAKTPEQPAIQQTTVEGEPASLQPSTNQAAVAPPESVGSTLPPPINRSTANKSNQPLPPGFLQPHEISEFQSRGISLPTTESELAQAYRDLDAMEKGAGARPAGSQPPDGFKERVTQLFGVRPRPFTLTFSDTGHSVQAFALDLPNGKKIYIDANRDHIFFNKDVASEKYGITPEAMGQKVAHGKYRPFKSGVGLIELLRDADDGTISHEMFHAVMDLSLTASEKQAVLARYGTEEKAAEAYRRKLAGGRTLFEKIHSFIERIRDYVTGSPLNSISFQAAKRAEKSATDATIAETTDSIPQPTGATTTQPTSERWSGDVTKDPRWLAAREAGTLKPPPKKKSLRTAGPTDETMSPEELGPQPKRMLGPMTPRVVDVTQTQEMPRGEMPAPQSSSAVEQAPQQPDPEAEFDAAINAALDEAMSSRNPQAETEPAATPKVADNVEAILSKVRREANARDMEDHEQGLRGVNTDDRGINPDVGSQFWGHGLSPSNLRSLLENGIDKGRQFHSAPLHGGYLLRTNSSFMVVGKPGVTMEDGGIRAVIVDPLHSPNIPDLQQAFPGVEFIPAEQSAARLAAIAKAEKQPKAKRSLVTAKRLPSQSEPSNVEATRSAAPAEGQVSPAVAPAVEAQRGEAIPPRSLRKKPAPAPQTKSRRAPERKTKAIVEKELREFSRKNVSKSAKIIGQFIEFVKDEFKPIYEAHVARELAKKHLRDHVKKNKKDINQNEDGYRSEFKGQDEAAMDVPHGADYAALGLSKDPALASQEIWDILKEGVLPPPSMTDEKFLRKAADYFNSHKDSRRDKAASHPSLDPFESFDSLPGDDAGDRRSDSSGADQQESEPRGVQSGDSRLRKKGGRDLRPSESEGDLAADEGAALDDSFDFGPKASSSKPAKKSLQTKATARKQRTSQKVKDAVAKLKAASADVLKASSSAAQRPSMNGDLKTAEALGRQMKAAAELAIAAIDDKISTFAEYVAMVAEHMGYDETLSISKVLERTWDMVRKRDGFGHIEAAGKTADVIKKPEPVATVVDEEAAAPAGPAAFTGDQGGTTGTKNAKTDELRAKIGMEERPPVEPESVERWHDEAAKRMAADPQYASDLAKQLAEKPRAIDSVEEAAMGQHLRDLENRRLAGENVRDEMRTAIEADEKVGTIWGRAGVSRQEELNSDFSLAGIIRQHYRSTGEQPSDAKMAELEKRADQLIKENAELKALLQEKQQAEIDRATEEYAKKSAAPPKKIAKKDALKQQASDAWAAAKEAWAAVAKAASTAGSRPTSGGLDTETVTALAKAAKATAAVVKVYAEMGVNSFLELVSRMKSDFGDITEDQLTAVKAAWGEYRSSQLNIPAAEKPEDSEIGTLARQLHRWAVESGIKPREDVIDAVHSELGNMGLELTRSQVMEAMSGYGEYRELSKDEISVKIREHKGEIQQLLKLQDMAAGRAPKRSGVEQREKGDVERQLTKQVNEAKKKGGYEITDPDTQLKSAKGAAMTALNNRIADLEQEIKTREKIVKERTVLEPDAEILALRKRRDELLAEHKKVFPPQKAVLIVAQRLKMAEQAIDRQISNLQADLAAGRIGPKQQGVPLTSPALEAKRAQLAALQDLRSRARAIDPAYQAQQAAKSDARYKASLEKRLKFWEQRRADARGGILPTKRIKLTPTDKAVLDKILQIERTKSETLAAIEEVRRKNLNFGQKIWEGLNDITSLLPRTMMAGLEMSVVGLQNFVYSTSHPVMAFSNLLDSLRSIVDERYALAIKEGIDQRANYRNGDYSAGKVDFTVENGPKAALEDINQSSILRLIKNSKSKWLLPPRAIAQTYSAFERGYRTYANTAKADMFDIAKADTMGFRDFFDKSFGKFGYKSKAWTKEDNETTGRAVNILTGRGTGLKTGGLTNFLLYAPRWTWSRIQAEVVLPFQMLTPKAIGQWNADPAMRVAFAKLYLQSMIGTASMYALTYWALKLAADDEEHEPEIGTDITSTDYGKIKVGDARINMMGGFQQPAVLGARIIFGEKTSGSGRAVDLRGEDADWGGGSVYRVMGDYARTKFGPGMSLATDIADGQDVAGNKKTPAEMALDRVTPMTYRDVYKAEQELNWKQGTIAGVLAFFGASVGTYGVKTQYRDASPEDRAKIDKSLMKAADELARVPQTDNDKQKEADKRAKLKEDQAVAHNKLQAIGRTDEQLKKEYWAYLKKEIKDSDDRDGKYARFERMLKQFNDAKN